MPNNTLKTVAHGASIGNIIHMYGFAKIAAGTMVPLPFPSTVLANIMAINGDNTNISIQTGTDRTNFTVAYITISYTKP